MQYNTNKTEFKQFIIELIKCELMAELIMFIFCVILMLPMKYIMQIHLTYWFLLKALALGIIIESLIVLPIVTIIFIYHNGYLSKN